MQIEKWMPWPTSTRRLPVAYASRPFFGLGSPLGRLVDELLDDAGAVHPGASLASLPRMDLVEHDDAVLVELELPGLSEEDIEITLDEDRLTIASAQSRPAQVAGEDAQAEAPPAREPKGLLRHATSFQRIVPLAWEIDREQVEAVLERGVLTVRLPKLTPAPETSRRIAVRSI